LFLEFYNPVLPLQRFNSEKTKNFTKSTYTWERLKTER